MGLPPLTVTLVLPFCEPPPTATRSPLSCMTRSIANLAPAFIEQIIRRYEGTRLGRQELEAELLIARDVKLIPEQLHIELAEDITEVRRMLTSLIQTLR